MTRTIGIHDSIDALFPPSVLAERLDDIDVEVRVVATDAVDGVDALANTVV